MLATVLGLAGSLLDPGDELFAGELAGLEDTFDVEVDRSPHRLCPSGELIQRSRDSNREGNKYKS